MNTGPAELRSALRDLDPATSTLTTAQQQRKEALRAALLASQADAGTTRPHGSTPVRGRRPRARWLAPVAATGIAASLLVFQWPLGSSAAYASWTPVAHPVSAPARAQAVQACRGAMVQQLRELANAKIPASERPTLNPDTAKVVVAEQRGAFLFLDMYGTDGSDFQCFFNAGDPAKVTATGGGLATVSTPAPRDLGVSGLQVDGSGTTSGPQGDYASANGRVGSDVVKVTIRFPGRTVRASLDHGHFAAWWPGQTPAHVTYALTLTNGKTITHDARQ